MQERTVYLETPASENATVTVHDIPRFDVEGNLTSVLRPVLVTEVPSEENRAEFAKQKLGDANMSMNFSHRFSFLLGMDSMLPQIALLKEENERLKKDLLFRDVTVIPERDAEIDRLKARVAELEGENQDMGNRISSARHYLMGVEPNEITVEESLIALGYNKNGH